MAALTIQAIVEGGLNASYVPAGGSGDTAVNDGRLLLHVKNADASARTVTVTAQKPTTRGAGFGALSKANVAVAVPAGEDRFIGPFPETAFNDVLGRIAITYSAVTNVTIAALRLPPVA